MAWFVVVAGCDARLAECEGTDPRVSAECGRALDERCAGITDEDECNDDEGFQLQEARYACRWATMATFRGSTCEVDRIRGRCVVGTSAAVDAGAGPREREATLDVRVAWRSQRSGPGAAVRRARARRVGTSRGPADRQAARATAVAADSANGR
jgi:hypothetical protein